jgi:hypothetical protein
MFSRNALYINVIGLLLLVSSGVSPLAVAQSVPAKLKLNAELVLSPEFCSSEFKRGNGWTAAKERYPVGAKLCPVLEAELPALFLSMKKSEQVPAPNATNADVILVPKIQDISATMKELVVEVEWTALDRAGKTLWVQAIQASGTGKVRGLGTGKLQRKHNEAAIDEVIAKSKDAISSSPELLKLVQ